MTDNRMQKDDATETHIEEAPGSALTVVDLARQAAAVRHAHKNFVLARVNDHCVRMAVMVGEYPWHRHPHSDECFLVLEGVLEIDVAGERTVRLVPGGLFTIPAGVRHRTRAAERCVNLCFEGVGAYTDVIFDDDAAPA